MANITVTTPLNHDDAAASGLLNGDDYLINGGALTINSDVRWGQNAAFPGNLTISPTLGGSVLIDGRETWWMAYDAPSGNVPALGTQGVQNCTGGTSGSTGEFLGIFTALGVAPSTAGGAMPATGFIKFRRKVGTFVDNEVVTLPGGATITVNSATGGQRGWIHIVGEELSTINVPRLGSFTARGDWFDLGTTNGADDQTFQYPVTDACPAIQIETSAGSGIYEWYLNAGSKWATATQLISTDARGKYFGQNNATGLITIAQRATNACGFKPATGCKVRIPNILISNSTTAAPTANSINATLATRWDFTTTAAGAIDIDRTCGNWYLSWTSAFSINYINSCYLESAIISNTASTTNVNNVACGLNAAAANDPFTFSNLFSGVTVTDYVGARGAHTGSTTSSFIFSDCVGVVLTRVRVNHHGAAAAVARGATVLGGGSIRLERCSDVTIVDCEAIGAQMYLATCVNVSVTGFKYADIHVGNTNATNPSYGIRLSVNCNMVMIDGYSAYASVANVPAYSGMVLVENCSNVEIDNIATTVSPYDNANLGAVFLQSLVSTNLTVKRVYTQNNRTSLYNFVNTVQGVVLDNVWGDAGDSQAIAALNVNPRGQRFTNSVTGQSSVYGRHWEDLFLSTTTGRILIAMNEPLAATAAQVSITAGTPKFTSAGNIVMPTVGDQVIWEMPRFVIGHTALANIAPTVTGTLPANMTLEYQIDLGSGYNGTWLALTGANLSSHTIPAFVNLYQQGGFRLKVRATTNTANTTNALTYITIATITTAIEQARTYPFYEPLVGYSGTQSASNFAIFDSATNERIRTAVHSGGNTSVKVPWDANYSAIKRLRKPGWVFVEDAVTVDFDGELPSVTQVDYTTIPDTDPGALGITVTNHGASPVTWNSKQWSITITTTNDSLTAAQIANFINYYTSQFATFNGFGGLSWPEMIKPDGSNYQTARGRLIGSAGTTLKGIRVVRSDGTTAVLGFSQMQADDGTYYVLPVLSNVSITGFVANSRVFVKNVTTNTILHNAIIAGTSYSDSYVDGTDFTNGDTFEVRITYVNGLSAKLPFKSTGTVSAAGFSVSVSQVDWSDYTTAGVDGSTVTEFTTDYANVQADANDLDNSTQKSRIAAFIAYAMHNEALGIQNWFGAINYRSAGLAIIDATIAPIKIDNINPNPLNIIDSFQLRMSDGSSLVDTSTYTIRWDNSAEVVVVETGTSGLTPSEADTLAKIDALTEDVSGIRFTAHALSEAPAGGGGGGGATAADIWAYATRTLTANPGPTVAQIRTEIDTNSTKLDVAVSSRLPTAGYTSPDNAGVAAIKAKTDNLPADPASNTQVNTRLASGSYTAPDNSGIAAIKAKTDNLPSDPADQSLIIAATDALLTAIGNIPAAPSAATVATEVWEKSKAGAVAGSYGEAVNKTEGNSNLIPAAL